MAYDIDTAALLAKTQGWFSRCEFGDELAEQRDALIAELEATRANEKHEERRRSFEAEKYEQRLAELAARVERTEADAANLRIGLEVERHATDEYRDRAEAAEARIAELETMVAETRSIPAHEMRVALDEARSSEAHLRDIVAAYVTDAVKMQAALDRVEALCDANTPPKTPWPYTVDVVTIRAALRGDGGSG